MLTLIVCVVISTIYNVSSFEINSELKHFPMLMPNVQPKKKDAYLCVAYQMSRYESEYIIELDPRADENSVHHILILGCQEPGIFNRDSPRAVWDCPQMHKTPDPDSPYKMARQCNKGITVIYDWSMGAGKKVLPDQVGFKVGKGTNMPFLVMQVHYSDVDRFIKGDLDQSGVILTMLPGSTKKVTRRASIVILGSVGTIPANSTEHFETQCKVNQSIAMHPFAFQPHTHKLGTAVSGWLIQDGQWKLIGKGDPQKPEEFYPVKDQSLVIYGNDTLAARCTYNNYLPYPVSVGETKEDEMCNFYLMYWVDGDDLWSEITCWTEGAPKYHWSTDPAIQVPPYVDQAASTLD